ncbi:helix-turn-helix domain-containing protein [Brevibacterium gallinarum]|uniref:Helix-turn-helix transcriptional regulator n=1 Tax=Brevibacterium gallinarum TaxID=2762220 RepID=A0ABR8WR31_9MICO|nr:helix-turn-helix transcriptional regulator [Brevibacterium gallinarum]MBD8019348.1 helix-turn-helix transcriptional regulator [Brevibacterium gallinarum]
MNTNELGKQIGRNVRAELARRGKTQQDLCVLLHRSANAVSRRIRGEIQFDVIELDLIARYLDVPMMTLIGVSTNDVAGGARPDDADREVAS